MSLRRQRTRLRETLRRPTFRTSYLVQPVSHTQEKITSLFGFTISLNSSELLELLLHDCYMRTDTCSVPSGTVLRPTHAMFFRKYVLITLKMLLRRSTHCLDVAFLVLKIESPLAARNDRSACHTKSLRSYCRRAVR